MQVKYLLEENEILFLRALLEKDYPQNAWSGRMTDDEFISKWGKEIKTFRENKLTEKKDNGHSDSYWCYGLNKQGLELQKEYMIRSISISLKKSELTLDAKILPVSEANGESGILILNAPYQKDCSDGYISQHFVNINVDEDVYQKLSELASCF